LSCTFNGLVNGTSYTATVKATNAVGVGAASAGSQVVPQGLPLQPAQPTGSVGNQSVTVNWTAPNDGGSPITGYTVTLSGGVSPLVQSVGGGVLTTTFVGLVNGTSYTATVKATNTVGVGSASTASIGLLPVAGVPAAPLAPSAVRGDGQLIVNWTAPNDGGSPITGYTVTLSGGVSPLVQSVGGGVLTTTFVGLVNGTSYTATVKATNTVGVGSASAGTVGVPVAPTPAPTPAPVPAPVPNLPAGSPFGSFDVVSGGAGSVSVSGWAIDPESAGPIPVHVYIYTSFTDRAGYVLTANQGRADIGAAFPGYGPGHGFSGTVPSSPGVRIACVFAINVGVGDHTVLGCKFVTVT
jgi:hypothetical protein